MNKYLYFMKFYKKNFLNELKEKDLKEKIYERRKKFFLTKRDGYNL